MTESAFDRDSILVAERPYFGPRQIKDRREIKEGATIILVDLAGRRRAQVTRKPWLKKSPWLRGKEWVFEVEYLEGLLKGIVRTNFLADYGVEPYNTPRGKRWNRTSHLLRTEEPRPQKLARIGGIFVLVGAAFLAAGLFFDPPSILLGGIGVALAVVALTAAIAGYRAASS